MKLGSSRQRERQRKRRRFFGAVLKWGFLLGLVLAAGVYAWQTASNVARRDVIELSAKTEGLQAEVDRLQVEVTEGRAREAVLEGQIPAPAESKILDIIRGKMREGVSHQRLAEVVSAATPNQNCDNDPMSRRFQVSTAVAGNESSSASFAGNTLTVRAEGQPTLDAEGRPEAWYDPAKPVVVVFSHVNGVSSRAEGVLPLQHSVAIGSSQYRFQLERGPRSFIVATMDRCDYP